MEGGPLASQLPARAGRDALVARARPRLPRPPIALFGRGQEYALLRVALADPGLVIVHGEGGVGKSALVASICVDLARDDSWQASVAWVDFDQYPEHRDSHRVLLQVLRHIAESLSSDVISDEQLYDAVLDLLDEQPALVVLDNVERFHLSPQLRAWIDEASHSAHLLLTTRGLPPLRRARNLHLEELSADDAERLFLSLWHDTARRTANDAGARKVVREICDEVGHLPLALELVASRRLPLEALLESVRDQIADIASTRWPGPERQRSMSACFRLSYDQLEPAAQRLFLRASVLPGGASTELLNAIIDDGRWSESAEQLVDAALWRLHTDRYMTHPLIRRFALRELGPDRAAVESEVAGVVVSWLERQGLLTEPNVPHRERLQALDAIEAEWRNVMFAVDVGSREADAALLSRIGPALRDFCWQRSHWEDCEPIYRQVLAAHRSAADPMVTSQTLECLGLLHQRAGDWPVAADYFADALDAAADLDTPEAKLTRCRALYGLGLARAVLGRPEEAKPCLERSVALASEIHSPTAEAIAYSNLAVVHISERDWHAAHSALTRSLTIRAALGDRSGEGDIHLRLATVAHMRGDFAEASAATGRAVELFREIDNRLDEMIALVRRAENLRELGRWPEAIASCERALEEFRRQGHHVYYEAVALNEIAMTRLTEGSFEPALTAADAALDASAQARDATSEAFARFIKGSALLELGAYGDADGELAQSQEIFAGQGDALMSGRVDVARARLLRFSDPARALTVATAAEAALADAGDLVGALLARLAMADAELAAGTGDPVRRYREVEGAFREKRIGFRVARCQLKLAGAFMGAGDLDAAREMLAQVEQTLETATDPWSEQRREALAVEIKARAKRLRSGSKVFAKHGEVAALATDELLRRGESNTLEYKRHAFAGHTGERDPATTGKIIKAVAGFLNSYTGGTLLIGVDDASQRPLGLEPDYAVLGGRKNRDGFENELLNALGGALGKATMLSVLVRFETIDGLELCRLDIGPASEPVHLKRTGELFVRVANSTRPLPGPEASRFVRDRWPGR